MWKTFTLLKLFDVFHEMHWSIWSIEAFDSTLRLEKLQKNITGMFNFKLLKFKLKRKL